VKWGFVSDAHGNLEAFELAVGVLAAHGAEKVIFLGDAVGYLPGDGVVSAIRKSRMGAVLGNHEEMLLGGEISSAREPIYRLGETASSMSAENRDEIASWPRSRELEMDCGRALLVHGSPTDVTRGYVYPDTKLEDLAVPNGMTVFMGNTHRPFVRRCNDALFVNVGSCGLPRDSGDLGAVCLFDDRTQEVSILRFDITQATERALRRCGGIAPEVASVFARRAPAFGDRVDG
jgi:putative phosphoesterase